MLTYLRCLFRMHHYGLQQIRPARAYQIQKLYHKPNTLAKIKKSDRRTMDGWLQCGGYSVYVWSISGLETCVVVKSSELLVAFDIGYAVRESVSCKNVFISHGHMDHIAGLPHHAAKRALYSMSKARYHVPSHLAEHVRQVAEGYNIMAETTEVLGQLSIMPMDVNDAVWLPNGHLVKAFPTVHRVKSQGYLVYKQHKKLKTAFVGKPGHEIATLIRQGVTVHDITLEPELAYTGDTMIEVFLNPPNPDLLNVKVLITEATYIDSEPGKDMVQLARKRGHMHLEEIVQHADLFKNIDHIVLMHFSDKYPGDYIRALVKAQLPLSLSSKVLLATLAKDKL